MKFIRAFKQISKQDVNSAGGKGASLGEMTQAKIPVPDGFVILSETFEEFIKDNDLNIEIDSILSKVNTEDINTIEQASEKIQALIINSEMSKNIEKEILNYFEKLNCEFVAVRSSATSEDSASAAWAGQLDTYLNTTKNNLLENVKKCWASLFTPRAIFYRFEQKLDKEKVSVAVVVQKMIDSEKSGIAFSVHPVTQDRNQLIIEAGFGLGEAVVSGQITPDSYVVRKKELEIVDVNVNEQSRGLFRKEFGGNEWRELENGDEQVLSEEKIVELSELIVRIENHYGFPCDIEWAYEKGEFYITQSRPITTLGSGEEEDETLDIKKFSKFKYHYFHNRFRTPTYTYLLWEGLTKHYNKNVKFKYEINNMINLNNDLAVDISEWNKLIKRINQHLERNQDMLKVLMEQAQKLDIGLLNLTNEINSIDEIKNSFGLLKLFFQKSYEFGAFNIFTLLVEKKLEDGLKKILKKEKNANEIFQILTTPIEPNAVQEKELDLLKIAISPKNKQDILIKNHLDKFAWLKNVSYNGDFYNKKDIINEIKEIKNPRKKLNESILKYKQQRKSFNKYFNKLSNKNKILVETLSSSINFRSWRTERFYHNAFKLDNFFKKISKVYKIKNYRDIFYLTPPEILELIKSEKVDKNTINSRKNGYIMVSDKHSTRIYSGDIINDFKDKINLKENTNNISAHLRGQIAFPGIIKGQAKIINSKKEFQKIRNNDIIVTEMTTPDFVSILKKASAIITNEGGITSHAAIIARELSKPCIIGTKIATQVLKDGDYVEVDANKGVVRILENNEEKESIISQLKKHEFEKYESWSILPTISWEYAVHGNIDNPYFKKLKIKNTPNMIVVQDKKFEVWQEIKTKIQLSDKKEIKTIIKESYEIIKKYKKEALTRLDKKKLDNKICIDWLNWINDAFVKIYNNYSFYTEEYFNTTDKDLLKQLPEVRMDLSNFIEIFWKSCDRILDYIKDKYKISRKISDTLVSFQIIDILSNDNIDYQKQDVALVILNNKLTTLVGKDVGGIREFLDEQNPIKDLVKKKEIKGNVAYAGFAKGEVVKITEEDYGKYKKIFRNKKDFILVATMTRPEIMQYLKKAKAIITDEGGITCHAAIVSRELKIPCIIGAKVATQVLKDGDYVEVDATKDKGEVRVLGNNNNK